MQLGPFQVQEAIGQGGMAAVFRGRHLRDGTPAALKVLTSESARTAEYQHDFQRELQALARLDHPGIATVYEYGNVGEAAARRGPESVVRGAPWMALQHIDGPILNDIAPNWGWKMLSSRLLELLDALAHAHAKEVLHRDLKPSNILVPSDGSRLVIADFGVAAVFEQAHQPDEAKLSAGAKGTPKYMAPEQILGRWRHQGPWTDLYALGCMTWRLICGEAPFDGETTEAILEAHLKHQPPPFEPQIPVPEGTEAWVGRMIAAQPDLRFRRAADAAWALEALPDLETAEEATSTGRSSRRGEPSFETLQALPDTDVEDTERESPPLECTGVADTPPVPEDWRRNLPERSIRPSTAGLGLFGLRETPFVDRDAERDAIWEALREVERTGEPRVVSISGESGSGKSRLVDWMAMRAHELGAASIMQAVHTPGGRGPSEGLAGMVRRRVRGFDLDREAFYEHLTQSLPSLDAIEFEREADARGLTELVYPTDGETAEAEGPSYRFSSPEQKYAVLKRLMHRYGRDRPLVVWLDDIQWGKSALSLVEYLVEEAISKPPVLLVVTLRTGELADDPELAERVDRLGEHRGARHLELEPLSFEEHRRFVERLLPLEDRLADKIAARTEGNPLFARQLIGDLVESGKLEAGDRGFRLPTETSLELPDDIHELWVERLRRVVDTLGEAAREEAWEAVEVAAALGREVDGDEWQQVCADLDLEAPAALLDALVERGLAERGGGGWAFTHGLLVESLERRARRAGRWREHHRRSASILESLYADRLDQLGARHAVHWIRGGEPERALEPLFGEARRRFRRGEHHRGRRLLERRRELLDSLEIGPDDRRRLENQIEIVRSRLYFGAEPATVEERLAEIRSRVEQLGDARLASRVWATYGRYCKRTGEPEEACRAAKRAARKAEAVDDAYIEARTLHDWGMEAYMLGDFEQAESCWLEARRTALEADNPYSEIETNVSLGWLAMARGEEGRAEELFEQALRESQEAGYRSHQARAMNGLGELARFQGDVERAREYYLKNRKVGRELGHMPTVAVTYENIAQVELMDGRFEAGREELEQAEQLREREARSGEKVELRRLIRLGLAAGGEDWEEFDDIFEAYSDGWPEGARMLQDHSWLLEMAGDYADEAGADDRAARAWRLARQLWVRLDDPDAARQVDEKLGDA